MTVVTKIYPTVRFAVRWSFCPAKSVGPGNYDTFDMRKSLGEDSYRDLSGIRYFRLAKKCKALARDSLSLLAYVK